MGRIVSRRWISAEFLHHLAAKTQVVEGHVQAGGFFEAKIDEEDVLPGTAGDGARVDAGEIQIGVAEGGQRVEEGAGPMLERKGEAKFVGAGDGRHGSAFEYEEAGVIFRIQLFIWSIIYRLPVLLIQIPPGPFIVAAVAGPPSPE